MTIERIQVKETQRYWGDFEGTFESLITSLQAELDDGWEGIIAESYGYDGGVEYYLYKHREENDKEYNKRIKQLEKEKEDKAKAKAQKIEKLKKELSSLSKEEKEQLGLTGDNK
jgi:hypothetical protein